MYSGEGRPGGWFIRAEGVASERQAIAQADIWGPHTAAVTGT